MPASVMLARRIKDAVIPATTGVMSVLPTGATNGFQLTSHNTTAGTAGSYVEVIAADTITSDIRITSAAVDSFSNNVRHHVTVAIGAAASEVEIGTFVFTVGLTSHAPLIPVSMPNIPANTRVSMKVAVQNGTSETCRVNINYVTV
jgi:hypothetical protein